MADKGDMRRIDLVIIQDEKSRNTPGAGKRVALVQWVKSDKNVAVQLGKFEYWVNENDKQEYVKIKCLSLGDIQAVFGKGPNGEKSIWETKCLELMKTPPAVKPLAPKTPPVGHDGPGQEEIEEVPF